VRAVAPAASSACMALPWPSSTSASPLADMGAGTLLAAQHGTAQHADQASRRPRRIGRGTPGSEPAGSLRAGKTVILKIWVLEDEERHGGARRCACCSACMCCALAPASSVCTRQLCLEVAFTCLCSCSLCTSVYNRLSRPLLASSPPFTFSPSSSCFFLLFFGRTAADG
jgi:hypothetical protein